MEKGIDENGFRVSGVWGGALADAKRHANNVRRWRRPLSDKDCLEKIPHCIAGP